MKAREANLLKFLEGTKQFQVPIFQRRYSWKKEDCEKLWNDVLSAGQNEDIPSYFLGSIVSMQHGIDHISGVTRLVLIDGQQRLTTLSLLLSALGRAIEAENVDICVDRRRLERDYLFNDREEGELRYKQLLTKHDKETLIQLLEEGRASDNTSLLVTNYRFFANQLKHADLQAVYKGIQKLEIVDIALKRNYDDPQLIFESLNFKGVKLSPADLIRNHVLMKQELDFQNRLYETYWYPMEQRFGKEYTKRFHHFIRDYLTLKLIGLDTFSQWVLVNRLFTEPIYESFKEYVNNKKHPEVLEETIAEIDHYSEHYVRIVLLKEEDSDIQTCFEAIQVLGDSPGLNIEFVCPFLLAVYEDYMQKKIEKAEMIEVIRLIESYIFRRVICGVTPRYLNRLFAVLMAYVDKSNYLQSLKAAFSRVNDSARFPSDREFKQGFLTKDIYKPETPNYLCNYLLRKLENYESKEPVRVEDYTIEHVMPQKLSKKWEEDLGDNHEEVHTKYLHTIGNLTLTKDNSKLSNRPFKEKRDIPGGFRDTPLCLNQSLAQAERWDETAIEKRAEELFQTALKIWIDTGVPDTSSV